MQGDPLSIAQDEIAQDERGVGAAILGDGRPLLLLTGLALVLSGGFAFFLSSTGHFLPHDEAYLGMSAEELCAYYGCRIVGFMFHDRVAFAGTLIAVGALYLWLAEFPLRQRQTWAWWTFMLSGCVGFASFLTYLGYGYLDTWHGVATLILLPIFVLGLVRAYGYLDVPRGLHVILQPALPLEWHSRYGIGRILLLLTALGLLGAGLTIMTVGVAYVFVPQDLRYMSLDLFALHAISPKLVSLIAHDRAGFGGGLAASGVAMLIILWCGRPSLSLWQTLCIAGTAGFGCAIGVHFAVGYTDFVHLLPAYLGAAVFCAGIWFARYP